MNFENKIEHLCKKEAELINEMYSVSQELGGIFLHEAIRSFSEFLRSTRPNFIAPLSIEYRTFIIKLLLAIDEKYKDVALAEVLVRGINTKKEIGK